MWANSSNGSSRSWETIPRIDCGYCLDTGRIAKPNCNVEIFGKLYAVDLLETDKGFGFVTRSCRDCATGIQLLINWRRLHQDCPPECDLGIIQTHNPQRRAELGRFCRVCDEGTVYNRLVEDHVASVKRDIINERLARSGIAENLKDKTFENFYTDIRVMSKPRRDGTLVEHELISAEESEELIRAKTAVYEAALNGESLTMCGLAGAGKSHLAAAYLNLLLQAGKIGGFISFVALMDGLKSTIGRNKSDEEPTWNELLKDYLAMDVLVLDDLGTEKTTDTSLEVLFYLLNRRMNEAKPTVVTTNYSLQELVTRRGYNQAIKSRLASFKRVTWDVEDWRDKIARINEAS
jgi:DNA replication protein DnaC